MAELKVSVPVNVGERIYFYKKFNDKIYVLSSPIAEIETITNKNETRFILHTNTGLSFDSKKQGLFWYSKEEAAENLEAIVREINEDNRKINSGEVVRVGGVINE